MTDWPRGVVHLDCLRRATLVVVALSLLAVPVSYTGGHHAAHPHAIVQLLVDAARGNLNHHTPISPAHQHEPAHPPPRLHTLPDGISVLSLPAGYAERIALLGTVIGFGLTVVFVFQLTARPPLGMRDGVRPRPAVPPPRRKF